MNLEGNCPTGYESLDILFTWELGDVRFEDSECLESRINYDFAFIPSMEDAVDKPPDL